MIIVVLALFVAFILGVGVTVVIGAAVRVHAKRYARVVVIALALRAVGSALLGQYALGKLCFREHDMSTDVHLLGGQVLDAISSVLQSCYYNARN
jgi:hypothetical protein